MKKLSSQILVGMVCILLGFMISYQLKSVMKQRIDSGKEKNVAEITIQMEQLQKQKENLEGKVDDLQKQVSSYEKAATSNNELAQEIVKELEDTRILTGSVDVEGEGVIIHITPQSEFFGIAEGIPIIDSDLIKIVNELNAADAEAISINDIRITSRTGIRSASNYIVINEERISPYKKITIKAIGNKVNLKAALDFHGVLDVGFDGSDIRYEVVDNVKVYKYDKSSKFQYAKPIKDK